MMFNALLLCALSSVALATTTTSRNSLLKDSPVLKVVKLLKDMQTELEAEKKTDEENFDKLSCWCETNDKQKTQSISDAEVAINAATAESESRTSRAELLSKDIEGHAAEATSVQESLGAAEAQREKDGKANQATIIELTKNLQAVKGAIIVLKKHQAVEFPQIKVSLLEADVERPSAMDQLTAFMEKNQYGHMSQSEEAKVNKYEFAQTKKLYGGYSLSELQTLNAAQKLVKSFAQVQGNTGEIFGILTTLQEQMARDLKELEEQEAKAVSDFDAMTVNLRAELATEEENEKRKTAERGDNGRALSAAKTSLEDNEATLAADTEFLTNLKKTCKEADAQFTARLQTRQEEITAVSEAIGILTEEDAADTMDDTLGSFLQMKSVSKRSNLRSLAAKALQKAAAKTGSSELLALSASVQLDGFVKVKKAINEMIADLKQQNKDEVTHKNFCQSEMHTNEMDTAEKNQETKDLDAAINLLDDQIKGLKADVERTKAEISQAQVDLQQANIDRVEESKEFILTIDDQRATANILNKALVRLDAFYGRKNAFLQQHHKKALLAHKQTPPVTAGDPNKKSSGAGGVVAMLENIIAETAQLEKEANAAEQEAQTNYENFVTETNSAVKAKQEMVVNLSEQLANRETDVVGKTEDLAGVKQELESLAAMLGDLHKSCDFVLKNFDLRQGARTSEIEALQQAMAILSGA